MRRALIPLILAASVAPAGAQSLMPGPSQAGRYQMQPIPGGVARLDTTTGEMSLCRIANGVLRCRPGEEDDAAAPPAAALQPAPPPAAAAPRAEEDAEIDRAIGTMTRVLRALRGVARELEDEPARGLPDRT